MIRFVAIGIASGVLFAILDGLINANPLAVRLFAVYQPIARKSINLPAAILIDVLYGFGMAVIFLLLYTALPGETGWVKGISFGLIAWFFRVAMDALSKWIMFTVPLETMEYSLAAGLIEMLVLGLLYGLTLKP